MKDIKNALVLALLTGVTVTTTTGEKNFAQLALYNTKELKRIAYDMDNAVTRERDLGEDVSAMNQKLDALLTLIEAKEKNAKYNEHVATVTSELTKLTVALEKKTEEDLLTGDTEELKQKIAELKKVIA